jgi:hypothetical protein
MDMVQTMFSGKCAQQFRYTRLSNNKVSRRIADISEDLEDKLIEKLRKKRFSMEIDEPD